MSTMTILGDPQVHVDGKPAVLFTPTSGRLACFTDHDPRRVVYLVGQAASSPYTNYYYEPEPGERISMTGSGSGFSGELEGILHRLDEGGYVLDKRHMDYAAMVALVIGGPMVDPQLPPGTMNNFGDRHDAAIPVDLSRVGGFTNVSLDVYLDYAEARGAKVGQRLGDQIHWRDGSVTEVPPCECWKGVCIGCSRLRYYVDRVGDHYTARARTPAHPADHCPACKAEGK